MTSHSNCACTICEVEQSLVWEIDQSANVQKYFNIALKNSVLSGFPTIAGLIARLRETAALENPEELWDDILRQLLRPDDEVSTELCRDIVILALIPAVHKLSRQVGFNFPALARDDIAQHLFTSLLEILRSNSVRKQKSHFAFTIIRLLRRYSYRWALRESKFLLSSDTELEATDHIPVQGSINFETNIHLHAFLSECKIRGLLRPGEYELLISFRLHGIGADVLAAQEGLSEIAFRHRIQRVIDRLRRIAQQPTQFTAHPGEPVPVRSFSRRSGASAA